MQDTSTPQPFVSLAQSYFSLLSRFTMPPQRLAPTKSPAPTMQKPSTAAAETGSAASAELMRGMARNYAKFLAEMAQTSMTMLAQGQAAMLQQVQQRSASPTSSVDTRGRRTR